jgi:hypothetical protein
VIAMPPPFITPDLAKVIDLKSIAGVTFWNRLEGRPRADAFDRALRAEVRDALWMLTRQWQMGELRGDDAGSPIDARVRIETVRLRDYLAADGPLEPFGDRPFESRVEPMPIPFAQGGYEIALDLRLVMGRYWCKLVERVSTAARDEYIASYPVHAPDPLQDADAPTCAHPEAWSNFAAAATRLMDGAKLYFFLKGPPPGRASSGIASVVGMETQVDALGDRFVAWFDKLIAQPANDAAWLADRLEYQFACTAPDTRAMRVLAAEEYFQGRLDWHNVDVDPTRELPSGAFENPPPIDAHTLAMMPVPVTFNGMPNTRWWAFEDGATNFGDVKPDTTDLAKLLLVEFGVVYANDWFLIPFTLPAGTVASVRGAVVTNVFGERTWIDAAGSRDVEQWQEWAMFVLSRKDSERQPAGPELFLPPSALQIADEAPREEIALARDEMANMVWGVERTIALPSGESKAGREAAYETRRFFERALERRLGHPPEPPPLAEPAAIRYQVMSSVPENWIPMIPVHVAGDNRNVQLQRAAMLRVIDGDDREPIPVRPRTSLLREGLDAHRAYIVHEEEVPRTGIRVAERFRRTRWRDGRVWVWLGVRKQTGRGEGSSGLAFDRIVEGPPKA